jgi:hypothetical protein
MNEQSGHRLVTSSVARTAHRLFAQSPDHQFARCFTMSLCLCNPQSEIRNPQSQRRLQAAVEWRPLPHACTIHADIYIWRPAHFSSNEAAIPRQPLFIAGQPPFISGQTALIPGQTALIAGQIGVILGFIIGELALQTPCLYHNMAPISVIYPPI